MTEGLLTVEASVPLDAPDFRYQLSGRLGRMSATAFNRFLSENESFDFGEGSVEGIDFRQTVSGGRALTTVTPRYHDVSVRPTSDGGGLLGSVKRAVKKFVANAFVVDDRNPDEDGDEPTHRPDRAPVRPGEDLAPVPLVRPSGWTDGSDEGVASSTSLITGSVCETN